MATLEGAGLKDIPGGTALKDTWEGAALNGDGGP